MRMIRLYQFIYVVVMLLIDTIFNSLFQTMRIDTVLFIGNLHIVALLLLAKNESREESVIKAAMIGLWMDMQHVGTFPSFTIAYALTVAIARLWDRFTGYTYFELAVSTIVTLFIKEILLFVLMNIVLGNQHSLFRFLATRSVVTIAGNLVLIPIAMYGHKIMQREIIKNSQNMYL